MIRETSETRGRTRKQNYPAWAALIMIASSGIAGCGPAGKRPSNEAVAMAQTSRTEKLRSTAANEPSTLSREHTLTIAVPESSLDERFRQLSDRCIAETEHHCTILESDLQTGDLPSGHIRLRIDPPSVDALIAFTSSLGELVHRSSTVEDLADAIQDTQSRLEMLTTYRKQLLELQAKAATNIDAAIKIASELSTVQANLERAGGEAAYQSKRTSSDVVSVYLVVPAHTAYWGPIRDSLRGFLGNLAAGLSQAITGVAYIVPWLLVVIPGLYLLRFLWRRRGR